MTDSLSGKQEIMDSLDGAIMTDSLGRKKEFMDSLDGTNYDGQSRKEERVN